MSNVPDSGELDRRVLRLYGARSLRIWVLRRRLVLAAAFIAWKLATRGHPLLKSAFDRVGAAILLVLVLPIMALTAIAIVIDSPGPVLFRQMRVGRWGTPFICYKFRSMHVDAEARRAELAARNEASGPVFKLRRDPRVTRVGRVIRKLSIDELPQFLNVLNGTMSLVGPRPPLPTEVLQYSLEQRRRLEVKPGITCIWQVSGRSNIDFERWVTMDLQYIDGQSFWMDLRLLARTIPAVLFGKGAY